MSKTLKLYTIDVKYIKYLSKYEPHLYREKDDTTSKPRKYIGVVLTMNKFNFFVPLTSFKRKHHHLSDSVDFIKIGRIAAMNINMMIPVPYECCSEVVIELEMDPFYRKVLYREQRFIQKNNQLIRDNAQIIYKEVIMNPNCKLARRSNDFRLLETACREYKDYT